MTALKKKDGTDLRIIESITSCEQQCCDAFAHMLLKTGDCLDTYPNNMFVRAVLNGWLDENNPSDAAVPRTWGALADCVERSNLDRALAEAIRDTCCAGALL